jgi:HlyD family secretion protein
VIQIRNSPVITQNVVTYVVVVGVDNKDLNLKPGMTANVSIETARKDNVLKIPSAALRFKPKVEKETQAAKTRPAGTGSSRMRKEASQKVYILDKDKKPAPVKIKTGISNEGQVEIAGGDLRENDEVIVEQVSSQKKPAAAGGAMGPRF